jgi:hypothetical protein
VFGIRDVIQIMSVTNSARSDLDICSSGLDTLCIRLRGTATLRLSSCSSASDHCRFRMQKKESLRIEFCGSVAVEEGSGFFWILIELTNPL